MSAFTLHSGDMDLDKPLRYLIGADFVSKVDGFITECGYDSSTGDIAYCNLFDEKNTGKFGPYLTASDTAADYGEGQIDPSGSGWEKNLREQFERRKRQGFRYIELDNPDAYSTDSVLSAIELARSYDLQVIAKNPGLCDDPERYVRECCGIIVERDAGNAAQMDKLRTDADRQDCPVWFVSFGHGLVWARSLLPDLTGNMYVSYSSKGEYGSASQIKP